MDETWKERFRARVVSWTEPARGRRDRALAASNRTGVTQLYGWDVGSTELRQLTDRPDGTPAGAISGDGRFVYYVDDRAGDELGHWVRVPFEGGPPEDMTPDLPPYASWDARSSDDGSALAFTAASAEGFTVFLLPARRDGPRSAAPAPPQRGTPRGARDRRRRGARLPRHDREDGHAALLAGRAGRPDRPATGGALGRAGEQHRDVIVSSVPGDPRIAGDQRRQRRPPPAALESGHGPAAGTSAGRPGRGGRAVGLVTGRQRGPALQLPGRGPAAVHPGPRRVARSGRSITRAAATTTSRSSAPGSARPAPSWRSGRTPRTRAP